MKATAIPRIANMPQTKLKIDSKPMIDLQTMLCSGLQSPPVIYEIICMFLIKRVLRFKVITAKIVFSRKTEYM